MEEILTKKEKRQLAKEEKKKERQKSNIMKKLRNLTIGLLVVGGLFFVGYRAWKWASTPVETVDTQEVLGVDDTDWIKGNPEAEVTLIEYADYECPACASYQPLLNQVQDEYPDKVKIVYRHFPLITIHPNAFSASKAAEAAGLQDKFWKMHEILYEKQEEWSEERNAKNTFIGYAESLELDVDKFKNDFESEEVKKRVEEDLIEAQSLGLSGTPTFYLNGKKLNGVRNYDDMKQKIEEALSNS